MDGKTDCIDKGLQYLRGLTVTSTNNKGAIFNHTLPYCMAPEEMNCPYMATMLKVVDKNQGLEQPMCMFQRMKKYQL